MSRGNKRGHIILLTGISGSGKTTLGRRLKNWLSHKGKRQVEFIDGDMARRFMEIDSGYTPQERFLVTKQMAYAAYLLANNGIDVIVANIAGAQATRDYLKRRWGSFIQIFLDADINDCIKNDPQGTYRRALKRRSPCLYGVDLVYEKPRKPHITVYPYKESIEQSLNRIVAGLRKMAFR